MNKKPITAEYLQAQGWEFHEFSLRWLFTNSDGDFCLSLYGSHAMVSIGVYGEPVRVGNVDELQNFTSPRYPDYKEDHADIISELDAIADAHEAEGVKLVEAMGQVAGKLSEIASPWREKAAADWQDWRAGK